MLLIKTGLRFFFQQLYHTFAWAYDLVSFSVSLGQWNHWVMAALEFVRGPRILELGFGPGHLQSALHQRRLCVIGLDESLQMADQATRRLKQRNYPPLLTCGLAQQLPFASDHFDTIIATFPSEYITHPATCTEIFRTLRSGGQLIVLTGASFKVRCVDWLFRITGQNADQQQLFERLITPLQKTGCKAWIETRETKDAKLYFVLAQKQ